MWSAARPASPGAGPLSDHRRGDVAVKPRPATARRSASSFARFGVQVADGMFQRRRQPDRQRHRLRPRSVAALLVAAVQQRRSSCRASDQQQADPLRAAELVGRRVTASSPPGRGSPPAPCRPPGPRRSAGGSAWQCLGDVPDRLDAPPSRGWRASGRRAGCPSRTRSRTAAVSTAAAGDRAATRRRTRGRRAVAAVRRRTGVRSGRRGDGGGQNLAPPAALP